MCIMVPMTLLAILALIAVVAFVIGEMKNKDVPIMGRLWLLLFMVLIGASCLGVLITYWLDLITHWNGG